MAYFHVKSTPEFAARTNDIQTTKICKDIRMGNIAAILVYGFFTFTLLFRVAGTARAQEAATPPQQTLPQEKTFTLSGTYSIEEIFDLMDKETGIYVNRSSKVIDFSQQLTVHFRNTPVAEVMDKVLGNQLVDWTYRGGNIILFRSQHPVRLKSEELLITVSGMVMDNDGVALPGVTIMVKGERKGGVTNGNGFYKIERVHPQSTLIINSIGFLSRQYRLDGERTKNFILEPSVAQIEAVEVTANTGYQVLKKRETPGAVSVIDSGFINRSTSFNILDRLDGAASGMLSIRTPEFGQFIPKMPSGADMGVYVRGVSTLSLNRVNPNPLIVLDNFPYEGDIKNLNANDYSDVTILKDATAAGVWGARSGNGVIVLTSKKGQYKERMKVDFATSLTFIKKPNLSYDQNYLNAFDYIEVERFLYDKGYFSADLSDKTFFPIVTPAVEIFDRKNKGEITQAEEDLLLRQLGSNDWRNDISKYAYRNALNQQYSIGVRGGTKDYAYYVSLSHDRNQSSMARNRNDRTTIVSSNQFKPLKNLEVSAMLNFSQQKIDVGNEVLTKSVQMTGGKYKYMYPYASMFDASGQPASIVKDYRASFSDSLSKLGFLDWKYRPIDEIYNLQNTFSLQNLLLRASIKYSFLKYFKVELNYQNERQMIFSQKYWDEQSYFARNLINSFSSYNAASRTVSRALPVGGIMAISDYDWRANSFRSSVSFQRRFKSHIISTIIGGELREVNASGFDRESVGYDNINGIPITNLNTSLSFPLTPIGNATLNDKLNLGGSNDGILNRYLSYYAIIDYNLLRKYDLTIIGRKDGTNLFGARTNERIKPFWSLGGGWHIEKEQFFKLNFVNSLKLRVSIGENGNIYNGSAYLTATRGVDPLTGLPNSLVANPANAELSWEKVRIANLGLDFSMFKNVVFGSIELFRKSNKDLVQQVVLAPQTGFSSAYLNSAATKANGLEVTLNGVFKLGQVRWYSKLTATNLKDELVESTQLPNRSNIFINDPFTQMILVKGKSLKGVFSYKWAGIHPQTGDPQGYLDGQISREYSKILNNFHPDSLVYHGSGFPQWFGNWRNDFSYKNIHLSFTLTYKFKYYFRRPSVELNYVDILRKDAHMDYTKRWTKPGDELFTEVPSVTYPSNDLRSQFYQRSEVLVERGDHIRLQDIRLSYQSKLKQKGVFKSYELFTYCNNIGILWRANRMGLDPDVSHMGNLYLMTRVPNSFSASVGAIMKL
ncbi:SusC/RagA family TonB-linked outer membrane protein [Chitinophaga pollutisoli]|uniref:SusC/RagA family TonB-linked outer membrane protein n=1 Tax=Chitinophaga pollutisoli TaxID=3133966 RepID=A0ABZ2YWG7_9BACT